MPILNWIVSGLLLVSAIIAGWFVAHDAPNFSIVQMAVGILLIAGFVAVGACWETVRDWLQSRRQ